MNTATDHYRELLAPIYQWMVGGADAACRLGAADLSALGIEPFSGASALDLGAGFGMHSIPLARLGYTVDAIDTSPLLISQLRQLASGLNIRAFEADLLDFPTHLKAAPLLILCMGDTLTHLSSTADVELLCARVAAALAPGGSFVTTFRDYTGPLQGNARFIPVRSDADRIHTCFLEAQPDRILVHDILHERQEAGSWSMHVSSYPKLRLDPAAVVRALEQQGLDVRREMGPRGMIQVRASNGRRMR
jgi:SAM-dependent methyltransferase